MPRASWRGFLRLSLVSCPIYLSPATTRTKPIRLHQVWQPVLDFAVIPAQKAGDLLHWEAANEHVAQLVQLLIRPFPAGVHGRRFIVRLGPPWIKDRGTYQAQQRFVLGISRAPEECAEFYIRHLTA